MHCLPAKLADVVTRGFRGEQRMVDQASQAGDFRIRVSRGLRIELDFILAIHAFIITVNIERGVASGWRKRKHADVFEVAVPLGIVQAITHHEFIGIRKPT